MTNPHETRIRNKDEPKHEIRESAERDQTPPIKEPRPKPAPERARFAIRRRGFAGLLLASVTGFCTVNASDAAPAEARPPSSIEVTAEAEVEIPPDLATFDIGVVTQADAAASASRQNSERMDAVLGALRKALGPNAQISTGTYSLRPNYTSPREGGEPLIAGYTASNVIQVKTGELARLGEVIDLAVQAGGNRIQRIAFTLRDQTAAHREALRQAALKARDEAESIASALGMKVVGFHSAVEQETGAVRPVMREAMLVREGTAPPTPVEPGLVQVRARVVLTVRVGP